MEGVLFTSEGNHHNSFNSNLADILESFGTEGFSKLQEIRLCIEARPSSQILMEACSFQS